MEQKQNPTIKKAYPRKSGLCIILGCFMTLYFCGAATAQWGAYFPAKVQLMLPITVPDEDIPQWELFTTEQDQLYALNFKTGHLAAFDRQGSIQRLINLPIPTDILAKNGHMWIQGDRIYLKPTADDLIWIFNMHGALLRKIKLQNATDTYYDFTDLVIDPREYFYLVDSKSVEIKIFNPDGGYEGVFLKKGDRANNLPGLPESFCLDNQGNFYLAVLGADTYRSRIVKYSYQGRFLTTFVEDSATHHYRTIWVDQFRNLYALAPEESLVVKFDSRGQKICQFQAGCLSGLAVNSQGTVFLASPKGNMINQFSPSRVITLIDRGNRALADNRLDQSKSCFQQALVLDNQLDYIHSILGEVYFHQQRFIQAMTEFQYLRDHWRYSQSLTSFRNEVLVNYGPAYGALLAGIIGLGSLLAFYFRKRRLLHRFSVIKVLWHPGAILQNAASIMTPVGAWILVLVFIVSHYLSWYYTNPIFTAERQVFSLQIFGRNLAMILILTVVWSGVAYKMGELFQGLAKYHAILAGTALSLIPMILGFPLLTLLSHLLTYDELWIYQWLNYILIFWVAGLFLMTLKETEVFSWSKALAIGLVNLAASGLVLLFIGFLVGVNQQLASFLSELTHELYTRLTG